MTLDIKKLLAHILGPDFRYPVGSYYKTSLPSAIPSGAQTPDESDLEELGSTWFDPNYAWGGTWVEDTPGLVTVAQDTSDTDFDTVGETGGSKAIQAHTHSFTQPTVNGGAHSHTLDGTASSVKSGTNYTRARGAGTATAAQYGTSSVAHTHSVSGGAVGGVAGLVVGYCGNLQPYIVVHRWHKIA